MDNLIPADQQLLCVISKIIDRNTETEHQQGEFCIITSEGDLAPVQKWNGEVRFLPGSTGPLQFVCEDAAGGYQIIKLRHEDLVTAAQPPTTD